LYAAYLPLPETFGEDRLGGHVDIASKKREKKKKIDITKIDDRSYIRGRWTN